MISVNSFSFLLSLPHSKFFPQTSKVWSVQRRDTDKEANEAAYIKKPEPTHNTLSSKRHRDTKTIQKHYASEIHLFY